MAQIKVSPDEMLRFARELEKIQEVLHTKRMTVGNALERLHQTWRDEKYLKFEKRFEITAQEIDNFQRRAFEYINYLARKAQVAREYLGRR